MTTTHPSLLEELATIDAALIDGTATLQQEKRGQQLVTLADAAPNLLDAALFALPLLEDYAASSNNKLERKAFRRLRDAIAKAREE